MACKIVQHGRFGDRSLTVNHIHGGTHKPLQGNDTLTAIKYWDEISGPSVRPSTGPVGPGFLVVCDNAKSHVTKVCRQFLGG